MALTPSTMLPLGTIAPNFSLMDTISGETLSLKRLAGDKPATVVMFICNHCPYVLHIMPHLMSHTIAKFQNQGVQFIAISSNDVETYPQDGPKQMQAFAKTNGFSFPYLYDETQDIARAYQAACTPDLYVFNDELACVYRGRYDDSTPGNDKPVTGKDLQAALSAVLNDSIFPDPQHPSMGCNIKWKAA